MAWLNRLRATLGKTKLDAQLTEEIQFHVEMRAREFTAAGMSPEEAQRKAAALFGNQLLLRDQTRDIDTFAWIGAFWQDCSHALRALGSNPGFALVAVLTLALGIGANTTIFSFMNAMLYRPLPLRDPNQLVMIDEVSTKGDDGRVPTMGAFWTWKNHTQAFQDIALAGLDGDPTTISGVGRAERVSAAVCGVNYFDMLGVKPILGRTFLPEDSKSQMSTAVVISESLWRGTFGADLNILGQKLTAGGAQVTIIGIIPSSFSVFPWKSNVDMWYAFKPGGPSKIRWLWPMGRLKPGVTIPQAEAELNAIARGMPEHADADAGWSVQLRPLRQEFVQGMQTYFLMLFGAVGFVLLIACANVANLLLARGTVRQKELAIRASLGAGRWRLIRQLLTESLLLSLMGGALGVLGALAGMQGLAALAPFDMIRNLALTLDWRVLIFTLGVSVLAAILFGLAPALRLARIELHEALKEGGWQGGGGSRVSQNFLIAAEVALGVVLLVGAGLMMNSFLRMQRVDFGFDPTHVLRAEVFLDGPKFWHNTPGYPPGQVKTVTTAGEAFYQRSLERIAALPGVTSVGISHMAPPGSAQERVFNVIGRPAVPIENAPRVRYNEVSPGFFASLKIPLVRGRYLSEGDTEDSPWVVCIDETMARRYFPREDPIGKLVQTTAVVEGMGLPSVEEKRPREIVGVVRAVRQFHASSDPQPTMYGAFRQHASDYPGGYYIIHLWKSFTIRTAGDPRSLIAPLQKAMAEVDKDQALFDVKTEDDALAELVAFPRFQMNLFSLFGGIGLLLAAVGIYGVTSYLVAQRTHEFGVRIALGATPTQVLRLVMLRGMMIILIGLFAGIVGALALTRFLSSFLYGVKSHDPVTYALAALVLVVVALVACYVPARRATHVDPLVALRRE